MVSWACAHCYAKEWAARFGWSWGKGAPRRTWPHDHKHWQEPRTWNTAAARDGVRRRVFTSSMADILDGDHDPRDPQTIGPDDVPFWDLDHERAALWHLIQETDNLDWLCLSKRPENWLRMIPAEWREHWPRNCWAGATMENSEMASLRAVWLIELIEHCTVRPPVIFASVEPIVGSINFTALQPLSVERVAQLLRGLYTKDEAQQLAERWRSLWDHYVVKYGDGQTINLLAHKLLDWVITGGESNDDGHARVWHPGWVRRLRDQCLAHGVAFFHKQAGEWTAAQPATLQRRKTAPEIRTHTFGSDDAFGPVTMYYVGRRKTNNRLDGEIWEQFPKSALPAPKPPTPGRRTTRPAVA